MMILLFAAAAAATPALSTPSAPIHSLPQAVAPVDPAALASARKLLVLMHVDQTIDRMMGSLVPVITSAVVGSLENNDATRTAIQQMESQPNGRERLMVIFSDEMLKAFRSRYPSIMDVAAHEYASKFSARELDEIIAFYSSGTGAKVLELMPELQRSIGTAAQKLGRDAGQDAGLKAMKRALQEMLPLEKRG